MSVHIDVRQLSGLPDDYTPAKNAQAWFIPYEPYHVEDGDDYLVAGAKVVEKLVDGEGDVDLPETPVDNLMRVQLRGVPGYGARWYVQIPAGDVDLFDLPSIDPETLDPTTPPSPAWLAALEDVQGDVENNADALVALADVVDTKADDAAVTASLATKADTSALTAGLATKADAAATAATLATKADQTALTSGLASKADTSALTSGLATKADTSALTSGLATKADASALTAETSSRVSGDAAATAAAQATSAQKASYLSDLTDPARALETLSLGDYTKLRPFFAKLANWRNERVDIAFLGDSNPEGFSLTNWNHTSPAQLQAMLRAKLGITTGARGFIGIQNDLVNKPFWPIVYTGGALSNTGYGANFRQIGLTGAGQKHVYTVSTPLTSFYIHYALFSTGTMYYKIDGGSAVNVVVNGTGSIVPTRLLVNSAVTSTIEIGWVSGQAYPCGIQENKGDETSGLQVHNLGFSGSYAKLWNDAYTANRSWAQCQAVLAPSLICVNLGGNDGIAATGNRTAAQFGTDLTTLLGTLGTVVSTTAPIVVNMQWNLGDSNLIEPWANYVAAARAVCAASSRAVLIDHSARMYASNTTDTLSLYNAASLPHATAKGYALYAATIAKALEPR